MVLGLNDIIYDSGCTVSIFNNLDMFVEYQPCTDLTLFASAGGDLVKPEGTGTVFIQTKDPQHPSKSINWTIQGVDYTLSSPANLPSQGKLRKVGIEHDHNTCSLIRVSNKQPSAAARWVSNV